MKHLITTITFLLLISITQHVLAQDFKDCETAMQVCGDSPISVNGSFGIGIEDDGVNGSCVTAETNSTWISWSVQSGGALTFNLVPDSVNTDLDFVVFKLSGEDDCTNKDLIRCMASGESIGQPSENCFGPTGLLIGDTDTEEAAGCQDGDNNYLAPIETEAGDHYVLLVNKFSEDISGFEISFGGDAVLDCASVDTEEISSNENFGFEVIPTVSSGLIQLRLSNASPLDSKLFIYDMNGKLVYELDRVQGTEYDIDLSDLASGVYVASLCSRVDVLNRKFVIAR